MKIHIPALGEELILTKKWSFRLHFESRNRKFFEQYIDPKGDKFEIDGPHEKHYKEFGVGGLMWTYQYYSKNNTVKYLGEELTDLEEGIPTSLPKGTELKIDRIYIRKGAAGYNSVSFFAKIPNFKQKIRFWAKLSDVNNIYANIKEQ